MTGGDPAAVTTPNGDRLPARRRWVIQAATLLAVVGLSLTLRSPISSLAVVLPDVQQSLELSPLWISVLTSMPVLCFAGVGLWLGARIIRIGVHRSAIVVLGVMSFSLAVRAMASNGAVMVGSTVLVLSAIAVGNVLIPAAAKEYFPRRASTVSSVLAAAIIGGSTLGAAQAGWIQQIWGWRLALASVAVITAATLLLWVPLARKGRQEFVTRRVATRTRELTSLRPVWLLTVCFGMVTAQAYAQLGWYPTMLIDIGLDRASAAGQLALLTGIGIPTMALLPVITRLMGQRATIVFLATSTCAGWLGILCAATTVTWLWSMFIGFGAGSFAWTLTMISRHTESPETTALLSGFVQGVGFLIAIVGPFGVGLLHGTTGAWTAALWLLVVIGAGIGVTGVGIVHKWSVEDLLSRRSTGMAVSSGQPDI